MTALRINRYTAPNARAGQRFTVREIGAAIQRGRSYLPIRNLAAMAAARAAPKDYLGQLEQVYNEFLGRWRYVRDPNQVEMISTHPESIWKLVIAGDGVGVGGGVGVGDCDDAAIAIGSLLESIGFPTRIATVRSPGNPRRLANHVFVQAQVPGRGWITVDPVEYPRYGFGHTPAYQQIQIWDLHGNHVGGSQLAGSEPEEVTTMYPQMQNQYGLAGPANAYDWDEYEVPSIAGEPLPWDVYGLTGFGCYADRMGYIPHGVGYMIEVDEDDALAGGVVRTPMLELHPGAYELLNRRGIVLDGTMALGDDGQVYEYDQNLGFFKKLIKKAKGWGRKIVKGAEKLIGKTKFGRKIIKLKNKILNTALKIVKPLAKIVGKWAVRLAPIAAMIPGVGPVIAGYLTAIGAAAKLMDKYGVQLMEMTVTRHGRKVKETKIKGKPKNILAFKQALQAEGAKAKKLPEAVLRAGAEKLKAHTGRLPRKPLGKVLKAGTPEYKRALRAIGVGDRRPMAARQAQPRIVPMQVQPQFQPQIVGRRIAKRGPARRLALAARRA